MARQDEIIKERIKKLEDLKKNKIEPYKYSFEKKDSAAELQEKHKNTKDGERTKNTAKTAGRVMAIRDIGKIIFVNLRDFSGDIQLILQKSETPKKHIDFFKKYIDVGDFIGIQGNILRTKRGELSILIKSLELLTKTILPLPEKFHGLKEDEERYRKRYLDMLMNPEIKEMFIKKSIFWNSIREFLVKKGFLEIETPVLEAKTGGADANPFSTHHEALDINLFLRISMGELWQKKALIGGFEKTFELGRQFRNEGISAEHLQDYTQMEFYWAYADYNDNMKLVEEMYKFIAKKTFGKLKFEIKGKKIDLGKKWKKISYANEIKKQTKIDILKATKEQIVKKLKSLKIEFDSKLEKERLIDFLWKHCRKNISGPAFIIDIPKAVSPLAKTNRKNPELVERFFILIAGSELGNGYSELNDPLDQESRFKRQQELREKGDKEAQMHDKEYVEALKYGMPPATGFGMSERVFAFLMDKPIRETVMFPLLRPEKNKQKKKK